MPRVLWLSSDGKKLLITRALRTFAYGYLAVVLAVYLDRLGLPAEPIGFLSTAPVAGFAAGPGLTGPAAYRPLFVLYSLIGLLNVAIFASLSPRVELAHVEGKRRFMGIGRSAGTVVKLSALFGLDAFAGALVVQPIVAYWFYLRWGLDPAVLAVIFFWVGVLSGLSLLAASWLAARIGLLNTMVATHLPSNVLLILVPLAPSAPLAVGLYLARMSISQMDVPTRQSYAMAVVDPEERTGTAGITNVARGTASSVAPSLTGLAFSAAAYSLPFFLSGALKIAYDIAVFFTFRDVRPPEEAARREAKVGGVEP